MRKTTWHSESYLRQTLLSLETRVDIFEIMRSAFIKVGHHGWACLHLAVLFPLSLMTAASSVKIPEEQNKELPLRFRVAIDGGSSDVWFEVDPKTNLQMLRTGQGHDQIIEMRDYRLGLAAVKFYQSPHCYIKALPHLHFGSLSSKFPKRESSVAAKEIQMQEEKLFITSRPPTSQDTLPQEPVWVPSTMPMRDTKFLGPRLNQLCANRPVYWLHPFDNHRKTGAERKKRHKRQLEEGHPETDTEYNYEGGWEEVYDAEEERMETEELWDMEEEEKQLIEEKEERLTQGFRNDSYNPENPYHRAELGEQDRSVTFDPMLDHKGFCCIACRRGYRHCHRVCEPLRGYWPWPYNYRGCRKHCNIIMPCSWWAARVLGVV